VKRPFPEAQFAVVPPFSLATAVDNAVAKAHHAA
jgi:hypothetical protein